ncbi:DUF418 domain-containing protein [Nocardiopsis composta]|uniref:DUF418 domain-containing protein n=1 Tax=Nocardiopsis composta TaxID=157465 RepID=A0A7W8QU89_9ACTN|nr:DUF418 domain-containing protein [Nocardiopsis composta]MBB5435741.1 uncharacterized protein [Nocardiopsis composta]
MDETATEPDARRGDAADAPPTGKDDTARRPAPGGRRAGRLPLLDVLRGLAILGTLGTNIWIFTAPGAELGMLSGGDAPSLASIPADPAPAVIAEALFRFAANGTSLSLLTLLFGAGLAIQFRSAARRGLSWPGPYKWRALFLFVEGLVHFTLVFAWDVLMGYAVTALVTAWLLARGTRLRRAVARGAGALHLALMAAGTAVLVAAARTDAGGLPVGPDVVRLYTEGSYPEQIAFRLQNVLLMRMEPVLTFGLLLVLFLAGVALFRAGAFSPGAEGRRLRVRMAAWGLGAGLPLKAAASLAGPEFLLVERYIGAPIAAIGLAGLVGLVYDRMHRTGPVTAALSGVGRTALSGYVLQNVLAMLACYGFGLGLASRFAGTGPWWVIGLWAVLCAVLIAGSALWLRRFETGPLEAVQKAALARIGRG